MDFLQIPLGQIDVDDEFNCRDSITPESVISLANNIAKRGLIQPIVVYKYPMPTPDGKVYRLVAGFRRYKAHQVLKKDKILSLVRPVMDEVESRLINIQENTQRAQLTMLEEAKMCWLLRQKGFTEGQIAEEFAQSRGWVVPRLKLVTLPREVQEAAAAGFINTKNIMQLSDLKDYDSQIKAIREIKMMRERADGRTVTIKDKETIKKERKQTKSRTQAEIRRVRDRVYDSFGPSFTTRVLAYITGVISEDDLEIDFVREAEKQGKTLVPYKDEDKSYNILYREDDITDED